MEKLKIGVVGLRFGLTVIENLLASADADLIELYGVYDLDQTKVEKVSKTYCVKAYQNFDEMLQGPAVQAVALYTPPTGRSNLIHRIMESDKHVITTKPLRQIGNRHKRFCSCPKGSAGPCTSICLISWTMDLSAQ